VLVIADAGIDDGDEGLDRVRDLLAEVERVRVGTAATWTLAEVERSLSPEGGNVWPR
jgi:hypothetical protein